MNVRAYNLWLSMLNGRHYPSVADVDPGSIQDFGTHGVIFDLSQDPEDPAIRFLGSALRDECGSDKGVRKISEVPARSLLSRLTDHYLQTVANRAPIGFEAEFINRRGLYTLYRGILMPLSEQGQSIDGILGVINWKELGASSASGGGACDSRPVSAASPAAPVSAGAAKDGPAALPQEAGLADRLCAAREWADQACHSDQRSRAALYRALSEAHDFALAAEADPETYAELLEDAGIRVQARAPMTPVVKLVFGAGYDRTRLTEFAAALAWARRNGIAEGTLAAAIEAFPGGLKGIVQSERRGRRPAAEPDRLEENRDWLRAASPFMRLPAEVETDEEFVLLVARRDANGLAVVSAVADGRLTEQAIRKSPGQPELRRIDRPEPAGATVIRLVPPQAMAARHAPAASLSRFRPKYGGRRR